ncbi:hypothetical protein ASPZODRAFT_128237 [Penicilliopsis zonata CBS 506.65]|uniref:Purine-cytosine permease n=1 Tax=Penicilliopsis zonata CBS 506.65 TaxID=1073090 RepID=A0A1L9SRI2_9EURO|nr:hypothetical protein ASPZODRAFT_128237 [Penicilliopsis zonata CBS 506.65]OJJ49726.1 hypothetical protein ASPZODRAFT_128237 [Penicilliopsis zonata CBS 506.65]
MGYYPNILCCALNVLTNIGYGMLNCTLGGQIVSKVSGGSVSVLFGIIIVALVSLVMAICGMRIFQIYERFSWLPQLIVLCVMIGTVGPQFDFSTPSQLPHEQVVANRVTFFFLSLSTSLAWVPVAADYYVYYPPQTKPWKTFAMTSMGLGLAMILTLLVGVGLGTAVASNPRAHDSPGSLIMAGYGTLGSFGKFCAVINAFGVIANNAPGAYSMSMNCQMLGDGWQKVPRPVFTVVSTIIYAACAIGGRNSLYEIFKNFLPLIGYWIVIWFVIFLEEHWFIRRTRGYDWSAWNDRRRLPLGLAAGIAFLAGWAGAIIGMDQIYYTGPVARAVAGGCDLGLCLAAGFTALVFPPIRMMELWTFRR